MNININNTDYIKKNNAYSGNDYLDNSDNNYFNYILLSNQNQTSKNSLINNYNSNNSYPFSKMNFVYKLYHMLSCVNFSNYIKWDISGSSFTIHDVTGFTNNVLGLYFRHNNFLSFIRSLNLYGFQKVINFSNNAKRKNQNIHLFIFKNKSGNWKFFHPKFIKDKHYLLKEIVRKNSKIKNNKFTGFNNIINYCNNYNVDKKYFNYYNNNNLYFNYDNMINNIINNGNNQNNNYNMVNSENIIIINENISFYNFENTNNYSKINNNILYHVKSNDFNIPYPFEITNENGSLLSNINEFNNTPVRNNLINSYIKQENEDVINNSTNISVCNQNYNNIQSSLILFSQKNKIENNYYLNQNVPINNLNIY